MAVAQATVKIFPGMYATGDPGFFFPPTRATERSAGLDLRAAQRTVLPPGKPVFIDTEVSFLLEGNDYGVIHGRSSMFQRGIWTHPGVMDADFTGTYRVGLLNTNSDEMVVEAGEAVGQVIFYHKEEPDKIEIVNGFNPKRPCLHEGFGSTSVTLSSPWKVESVFPDELIENEDLYMPAGSSAVRFSVKSFASVAPKYLHKTTVNLESFFPGMDIEDQMFLWIKPEICTFPIIKVGSKTICSETCQIPGLAYMGTGVRSCILDYSDCISSTVEKGEGDCGTQPSFLLEFDIAFIRVPTLGTPLIGLRIENDRNLSDVENLLGWWGYAWIGKDFSMREPFLGGITYLKEKEKVLTLTWEPACESQQVRTYLNDIGALYKKARNYANKDCPCYPQMVFPGGRTVIEVFEFLSPILPCLDVRREKDVWVLDCDDETTKGGLLGTVAKAGFLMIRGLSRAVDPEGDEIVHFPGMLHTTVLDIPSKFGPLFDDKDVDLDQTLGFYGISPVQIRGPVVSDAYSSWYLSPGPEGEIQLRSRLGWYVGPDESFVVNTGIVIEGRSGPVRDLENSAGKEMRFEINKEGHLSFFGFTHDDPIYVGPRMCLGTFKYM